MTKNSWGRKRSGGDLLQIRAADAAGVNPNQNFTGIDLRNRNGFKTHIVPPSIHGRLHRRRNVEELVLQHELSRYRHAALSAESIALRCAEEHSCGLKSRSGKRLNAALSARDARRVFLANRINLPQIRG